MMLMMMRIKFGQLDHLEIHSRKEEDHRQSDHEMRIPGINRFHDQSIGCGNGCC